MSENERTVPLVDPDTYDRMERAIEMALDEVKAPANESLVERIRGLAARPAVQADPLRIQATPMDGRVLAVEMALDGAKAPRHEHLSTRIELLAQQRDQLTVELAETQARATAREVELQAAHDAFVELVRQALNVGPPSASDVGEGTPEKRIVEIVRTRSVLMLEERAQRVALAQEKQRLENQLVIERAQARHRLESWMNGDLSTVGRALEEQVVRLTFMQGVDPETANEALRSRPALAKLVLSVDFTGEDIPF